VQHANGGRSLFQQTKPTPLGTSSSHTFMS
jgi:hypothetical protein